MGKILRFEDLHIDGGFKPPGGLMVVSIKLMSIWFNVDVVAFHYRKLHIHGFADVGFLMLLLHFQLVNLIVVRQ